MHITGGAFTKLGDLLNGGDAIIYEDHKLKPHNIFYELNKKGVKDLEMYKTFNCGIGFVIGVNKKEADACLKRINKFERDIIGEVVKGHGLVKINSSFSKTRVIL